MLRSAVSSLRTGKRKDGAQKGRPDGHTLTEKLHMVSSGEGNCSKLLFILSKNSGKTIIHQIASLLHQDMDRDWPVCHGCVNTCSSQLQLCVS